MDLSAFFGVVSTIDFAMLGLWWVTVQSRPELRRREAAGGRMAYLVSLQFVIPGTASLLAQIAPSVTEVWRISFGLAGIVGVLSIALVVSALAEGGSVLVARLLRCVALPIYAVLTIIAATSGMFHHSTRFAPVQVEAILFCVITLLGAQLAWAVAMTPDPEAEAEAEAAAAFEFAGVGTDS